MFAYSLNLKQNRMKNSKLLLVLFFTASLACNQEKKVEYPPFSARQVPDKGEKAIVHGKISNLHVYPHVNEVILTLPDFSMTGEMHLLPIDSTGEFYFEIYPVVPREFSLTPIEDRLMIGPGDTLYIEHDFSDITNTRFSGSAAVLNQQIARFRNNYLGRYSFSYELPYMDYKEACDQQLEETFDKLERFQKEHDTLELFNLWADKQVRLDYYNALFHFPTQHFIRTKDDLIEKEAYYAFLPDVEKTIDKDMILNSYFKVMEWYNIRKGFGLDPIPRTQEKPLSVDEAIELYYSVPDNNFFSQFSLSTYLSFWTKSNSTKEIDEHENQLGEVITHPFLRATLQNEYNRVRDFKDNPVIYSDAVMGYNRQEVVGTNFNPDDSANVVKHLIAEYPDKVLYIDVWATWCSPCIKEMPHSVELHEEFEGRSVEFVYLCMGGGHEQWQETIQKIKLPGIHVYLSESEWQDQMKRFNIKGIPYYLLFNKEGVLVDFGHHLRASIPETKTAIEELLEQ